MHMGGGIQIMAIEISNESKTTFDESSLVSLAEFALNEMKIHPESDLSITIVDENRMSELHIQWMDLEGPTDVMSFPMDEMQPHSSEQGPGMVGDIVLCPKFAAKQAKSSVAEEISILTINGVLHLLGFDHAETEEEKEMFALQDKILQEWNGK